MLSAARFIFVLCAAYVQGRLDLILFVHFGAVSKNPALKDRVPGCGLSGEMFHSSFCIDYLAKVTPLTRKLLGFVITAAERAVSDANGRTFRPA